MSTKERIVLSLVVTVMTVGFLTIATWNVERLEAVNNQIVMEG